MRTVKVRMSEVHAEKLYEQAQEKQEQDDMVVSFKMPPDAIINELEKRFPRLGLGP